MRPHLDDRARCDGKWPSAVALIATLAILVVPGAVMAADEPAAHGQTAPHPGGGIEAVAVNRPAEAVETFALFGLISLAPMGLLMVTGFVRINIVLILLRQALGSPQVPGNQVLTALSLMLTALVMWPIGEKVYHDAIVPYKAKQLDIGQAWATGTQPIKSFMVDQIKKTNHEDYLQAMQDYAFPKSPGRSDPEPASAEDCSLRVVAPAYLLSELTTALLMGFYVYLPFLVIDLVVSSVLAATGLFMLPPALVATPIKLIVFVLADGWILIATMLLSSFAVAAGGP
jgi:flagellar biosynthetic protein FliP